MYCPKTRPSKWARPNWTPRAAELLAGTRRARRRYNASGAEHDRMAHKELQHQLQKELRRVSRANWRRFVEKFTSSPTSLHNKNLWTLSRWSRRYAGKPQAPMHLPALRDSDQETATDDNAEKTRILAGKFFPAARPADLSDITSETLPERQLNLSSTVTEDTVEKAIKKLPNNKAPGPDRIPNEAIKQLRAVIQKDLAQVISNQFASGTLPQSYRESTTIALRKEGKKDYSLPSSYRPIALENTLAKLVEKILADQITEAAEEHNLLPWNQMGARKMRSTLSALELLTSCVQTAWRARPGCVVSMLSLDLEGAFDNVSHERLLWILQRKGYPTWITQAITNFLTSRRTQIMIPGYTSEWILTETGIPQGSPLSPVLFLFFISELLELFQRVEGDTLAFGFVDDTNLIAWGDSAQDNCRRLEIVHDRCITWAQRHGAFFTPVKYQLIHFTRRKRDPLGDLANTVRIATCEVQPQTSMRVLGVWVDSKMDWKTHIAEASRKGNAAFEALSRIVTSTWGPTMRRSRLIYSAVISPILLHGAQIWGAGNGGATLAKRMVKPLKKMQNQCLRKVMGAYKRTPTAALEREAAIPPIDLQITAHALERSNSTKDYPVTRAIKQAADNVWASLVRRLPARRTTGRGRRPHPQRPRPDTSAEALRKTATAKENVVDQLEERLRLRADAALFAEENTRVGGILGWNQNRRREAQSSSDRQRNAPETEGHRHRRRSRKRTRITRWMDQVWRRRWKVQAEGKTATTWKTPWSQQTVDLYEGLQKHEATALFLLRTEIIGLNAWLFSVGVPGFLPRCTCGEHAQTVRHILIYCPLYSQQRAQLFHQAGSSDLLEILSHPHSAQAAGRWLIRCGILSHLHLAGLIQQEDTGGQRPFPELS